MYPRLRQQLIARSQGFRSDRDSGYVSRAKVELIDVVVGVVVVIVASRRHSALTAVSLLQSMHRSRRTPSNVIRARGGSRQGLVFDIALVHRVRGQFRTKGARL